jgi:hypothetical protein
VDGRGQQPAGRADVEVVIPLRWQDDGRAGLRRATEMGDYLDQLLCVTPYVTVVDGSDPEQFHWHRTTWPEGVRHVRPGPPEAWRPAHLDGTGGAGRADRGVNGKVLGAMTGILAARCERIVLADDDVRLGAEDVLALAHRLADSDLVRPVNVFDRWPWHAWWDGGRTLLNTAVAADWPGVFALRRSTVLAAGGWSPEVLFENLELWRTLQAHGARTRVATDIVVRRLPPTPAHFWSQRVRQAYDDLAQPGRLVAELAVLPLTVAAARRGWRPLAAAAAATVAVAEVGRRRIGPAHVPAFVSLAAPVWLFERGVCVWLALGTRAGGGIRYHGRRLSTAAHPVRRLVAPRRTA